MLAPGRRRDDPGPSPLAEGTGRKSYHHEGSRRMSTPTASLATAGTPGLCASSPPPKAGLPIGAPCPGLWGGLMEKHASVPMITAAIDIKPRCLLAHFLNVASDILDSPKTFFLFLFSFTGVKPKRILFQKWFININSLNTYASQDDFICFKLK